MSHARIEEVSDSDPDYASDPSEDDIEDFDEREIIKARAPKSAAPVSKASPNPSLIQPSAVPSVGRDGVAFQSTTDESKYKDFQCIYPIYFDRNRSRKEGRRVGIEGAVENPLAREIVTACGRLRLEVLFEPTKMHPKDWANPGRVKVKLKEGKNPAIKNKHHLYTLISKHLLANPTTVESATMVKVPGLPPPDPKKEYPKPAVPKGWKMASILPYYSPGLTGGGVSENFLKDMMAEMGGGGGGMPGMPGMPGLPGMMQGMGGFGGGEGSSGAVEKKKEKKDKKKK